MHLLIPFASALSERGTQALRKLNLPHLTQLLARLTPTERFGSDEYSLSPPHEHALAHSLGWTGADGAFPYAAHNAAQDGIDIGTHAWGQLTPVHWHVGAEHVSLPDPHVLHLSAQESHTLFEAVRPLFETEGWLMAWGAPTRWYAAHDSLDGLPCASIDRVIGRNIDLWLPSTPQARLIRRLQNEVQMLLYQQPLNDARVGQGALPVNSFWLSGCGRTQREQAPGDVVQIDTLRTPALNSDWAAWADAWHTLDAGPVQQALKRAQQGEAVVLTLCGERFAQRFEPQAQGLWSRLGNRLSPSPAAPLLEAL
ncbi:MAG: hypothetical protein H7Y33_08375 [Cytophagales bacterium]|nr:hypothetical protein [Rhizobacter sp.]